MFWQGYEALCGQASLSRRSVHYCAVLFVAVVISRGAFSGSFVANNDCQHFGTMLLDLYLQRQKSQLLACCRERWEKIATRKRVFLQGASYVSPFFFVYSYCRKIRIEMQHVILGVRKICYAGVSVRCMVCSRIQWNVCILIVFNPDCNC